MRLGPKSEVGEYQALLIKSDNGERAFRIALLIIPIGMSLFFRVGQVYLWASGLLLLRTIYDVVGGLKTRRLGYLDRGNSILNGIWWWLGLLVLYGVLYWVQSRYQIWFDQGRLCSRTC